MVPNFIDGKFTQSAATEFIDVTNPATNEVILKVPKSTPSEMSAAVASARTAFETWSETPVQMRQRIMLDYVQLIKRDQQKIAESITLEQGKTIPDAMGDVFRGLEIVEMSSAIGHLMMGETQGNISKGIDAYSYREVRRERTLRFTENDGLLTELTF